jgi:hypothetical protein
MTALNSHVLRAVIEMVGGAIEQRADREETTTTPACRGGRSGAPAQGGEQANHGQNPRDEPHPWQPSGYDDHSSL